MTDDSAVSEVSSIDLNEIMIDEEIDALEQLEMSEAQIDADLDPEIKDEQNREFL